ncbi:hypothetical protein BK006_01680 [bacterium CG10_49_38]|nr:MAG: hypothetical protein BK006_01680 [bacterium CG10_49_38]
MYDFFIENNYDGVGVERSIKFDGTDKTKIEAIHTFKSGPGKIVFEDLLQRNSLCSLYSTFMHTKKAFEIIGGYPEDHGFDTQAFAWKFLANGFSAQTCPGAEYLHRINFHRSYYVREYEDGKVNHNWFKIFDEFFYLLSDEAKAMILGADLNNHKQNISDLLQRLPVAFAPGYEKYLTVDGRSRKRKEVEIIGPTGRTMYESYWLGSESLREGKPEDALRYFLEARQKKFRFRILEEKILFCKLCLSGKTTVQAFEEIEARKKYKKLGSQSPLIRKAFIALKKKFRPLKIFYIELRDRKRADAFWKKALALVFFYVRKRFGVGFNNEDPSTEAIDIVIPTITKDFQTLEISLESLKNLEQKINRVYIISRREEGLIKLCEKLGHTFIDESSILGYPKDEIKYVVKGHDRSGWIYKQLLNFGVGKQIEKENYFVIDSDTVLVSKNSFIEGGKYVFQDSTEWNQPYLEIFERIFKEKPRNHLSSVCHMMIFNQKRVAEMLARIETIQAKRWDQAIIDLLDPNEISSFAEYETYANYMGIYHPSEIKRIPFYNKSLKRSELTGLKDLEEKYGKKYKSVSFHSYAN